jgi:hypothetical protein
MFKAKARTPAIPFSSTINQLGFQRTQILLHQPLILTFYSMTRIIWRVFIPRHLLSLERPLFTFIGQTGGLVQEASPQVNGNDIAKPESIPAFVVNATLDLYTAEFLPEDSDIDKQPPDQPFPVLFPSALICQSAPTFELGVGSSSYPAPPVSIAQSPTSIATASSHSPDTSTNNDTDTSTDTGTADTKSSEKGLMTPESEKYTEEKVRNPAADSDSQFNSSKEGRNIFAFSAVPRFFKASFQLNKNKTGKRSATCSVKTKPKTKAARDSRPSSSSSSSPLVPKSPSFDISAAFPEYASFSPYPTWLVPGSGALRP